jgi:hypothetical protein
MALAEVQHTHTHVLTPRRVKEIAGECPAVAAPTLLLTLACVALELLVISLISRGVIAPLQGTAINTLVIFAGNVTQSQSADVHTHTHTVLSYPIILLPCVHMHVYM